MFIGELHTKVDNKGRAPFPAVFRKALSEGVTLIASKDTFEKCIRIQTLESWTAEKDRLLSRLNEYNKDHRAIFRQFNLNQFELGLDNAGRINIPNALIEQCEIQNEIVFIGMTGFIEIWSKENRATIDPSPEDYALALQTTLG